MGDRTPGSYVLVMRLEESCTIAVGRAGPMSFGAGSYCYCGSALGGLEARLARHARRAKPLHWHIDYFIGRASLAETWVIPGLARLECAARAALCSLGGEAVRRFGSSDCRCPGHLVSFERAPTLDDFNLAKARACPSGPPAVRWPPGASEMHR